MKILSILLAFIPCVLSAQPIDRQQVVSRHNIVIHETLPTSPAQVGNGRFAFGMDITGLQTFVPFNTLSDWGWHNSPLPEDTRVEDFTHTEITSYGRTIKYPLNNPTEPELTKWLKSNPHRINLGRVGMIIYKLDGSVVDEEADFDAKRQETDLWTGSVVSSFTIDGRDVSVTTVCSPDKDMVAVRVSSPLLAEGRIKIFFDYPYWDGKEFSKLIGAYSNTEVHSTTLKTEGDRHAAIRHTMDDLSYDTKIRWSSADASIERFNESAHRYILTPGNSQTFDFTFLYTKDSSEDPAYSFDEVEEKSAQEWLRYWQSGAAVDLSGSSDPRWEELERRIVLSQYLMRINECGSLPPQESGLVNNGWFGRFHWEMTWWHGAHWAMWGRPQYATWMDAYRRFLPQAKERAAFEGRKGARWPKCTGDNFREWPCDVHAFLCWQQPHPIYFAEQQWRLNPGEETLERWKDIVFATADHIADYPFKDGRRYVLGPPVAPVSENTDYQTTLNPIFELSYFRYALRTALQWAKRAGLPPARTKQWEKVLKGLAELPQKDGYYITAESMQNMWEKFNSEHPALTGVYGWLPGDGVDIGTFRRTFHRVLETWQMDAVWGWDYPMLAMAAARLGEPETAIDLLCATTLKYNFDEHGLAHTWPYPYFPANGGLLSAVAMMCGGWDGLGDIPGSRGIAPGFPKDGRWKVKYEGFGKMQ